jgi:hypothetical protein
MVKTDKVMAISQWGEFEAPTRVLPPVFTTHGTKVSYPQPLEYFDGEGWRRLSNDAVGWLKANA